MIRKVYEEAELDCGMLRRFWLGKKMLSYLKAYGVGYPFCQFFALEYEEGSGYALLLNSTLICCAAAPLPVDELSSFIAMHAPGRVEATPNLMERLLNLPHYTALRRTLFALTKTDLPDDFDESEIEFNPRLDDVYEILQEGFPNLLEYELWLADTSHCVRHGVQKVFTYKNATTATILYDVEGLVLIGQVATRLSARGSGYARLFLKWLAGFLAQFGKQAVLYALDIRRSFYEEIGFLPLEEEYVLERTDGRETQQKGKLN